MTQEPAIQIAGAEIAFDKALLVLLGYAFGTREAGPARTAYRYGEYPPHRDLPWYGYRTYDCIGRGASQKLEEIDILVVVGLNAPLDINVVGALLEVAPLVSGELEKLQDAEFSFWDLTPAEVAELDDAGLDPDGPNAPSAARAWPLYRAWYLLEATPGVGIATAHKVLHHKLPRLAPLMDNRTFPILRRAADAQGLSSAWAAIHRDLANQAETFGRLEAEFAGFAERQGTARLGRLRIHDILLWCDVTGKTERATELGTRFR